MSLGLTTTRTPRPKSFSRSMARSMQTALHCLDRDAGLRRRLGRRQFLDVAQDQYLAIEVGQGRDHGAEVAPEVVRHRFDAQCRRIGMLQRHGAPLQAEQAVAFALDDAEQPAREGRDDSHRADAAMELPEGGLNRILGIGAGVLGEAHQVGCDTASRRSSAAVSPAFATATRPPWIRARPLTRLAARRARRPGRSRPMPTPAIPRRRPALT